MRVPRILTLSICSLVSIFAVAQSDSAKQQKPNDYGVVGDTGEEADQPVNKSAMNGTGNNLDLAWQMLEAGMKDSKEQVRIDALNALGNLGGIQRAENDLQSAISDQNVDVRVAAVTAAGNMHDENMLPVLRKALTDDTAPEVVFAAAVALWKMHDPTGINVLYGVLAGDRKTQGSALQTGKREASKDLHDPGTLARIGAEQGAYALLGPFGIGLDAARLMMKSNNANSARILAVNLLSQDHSDLTKAEFISALGDKDYFVRAGAARVLGEFHGKDVTDALVAAFDDSKPSVRFMAAASYIKSTQQPEKPTQPAPPQRRHARPKSTPGD